MNLLAFTRSAPLLRLFTAALLLGSAPLLLAQGAREFSYAKPGRTFSFPRDHGSHPDFKIEWWYITGHLWTPDRSQRYGFQATFFRRAGEQPGEPEAEPTGAFADAPIYLAHMALLDAQTGRFIHQERLNRSGWDARSSVSTLDVRNGNWSLKFTDSALQRMRLQGGIRSEATFDLTLTPAKPLVFFGENGVSRKGEAPEAASHYLTFPRLQAKGALHLEKTALTVQGEAWMDHEISSSQLAPGQVGWDWAAIQLKDGREIMAYRMRLKDGSSDPYSTLAWIEKDGSHHHFPPAAFGWKPLETWKSPRTGAEYPISVEITAKDPQTGAVRKLRLAPLAQDQELTGGLGGVAYWEGACRVLDESGAEVGNAFLELAGYAGGLEQRLR